MHPLLANTHAAGNLHLFSAPAVTKQTGSVLLGCQVQINGHLPLTMRLLGVSA